jgi:uncharacterized protein YndB with AHSA1/START domain
MPQATATKPPMGAIDADAQVQSLHIVKDITIDASLDVVWESVLERHRDGETPDGTPMHWKFEAWPGGRWYRDLGEGVGHLWGHVQVIKPPKVLEICGPLFMSYAATSHVQYRLTPEGDKTQLRLTHTAIGLIAKEHREGVHMGWSEFLSKVQEIAERKR